MKVPLISVSGVSFMCNTNTTSNHLQEEWFHQHSKFTMPLMANSQNFNSADYHSFSNIAMEAYEYEVQKSKLAHIQNSAFVISEQGG